MYEALGDIFPSSLDKRSRVTPTQLDYAPLESKTLVRDFQFASSTENAAIAWRSLVNVSKPVSKSIKW